MLFECYNVVFIKQYETFFRTESDQEKEYLEQKAKLMEQKRKQDKQEAELN